MDETIINGTISSEGDVTGAVRLSQDVTGVVDVTTVPEEVDPTVPSWAKQPNPPTYTAEDVGARPDTWTPTAADVGARPDTWTPTAADVGARPDTWTPTAAEVGARPDTWTPTAEDVGARPDTWTPTAAEVVPDIDTIRSGSAAGATALQSYTETDPTVPSWAKASTKPSYTAAEVGASAFRTLLNSSIEITNAGWNTLAGVDAAEMRKYALLSILGFVGSIAGGNRFELIIQGGANYNANYHAISTAGGIYTLGIEFSGDNPIAVLRQGSTLLSGYIYGIYGLLRTV